MRHRKRRSRLSMMTARRNATMINMVKSLLEHQRINTIHARAKECRRLAERLITLGKDDTVASRRRAYSILNDRDLVGKLYKEIAPLFKTRTSGFTRIIPAGFRRGDGASLVILELTEMKLSPKEAKKKKEKVKAPAPKQEAAKESPKAAAEEPKKDESPIKHIPKSKPTLAEEKHKEKAKAEEKKVSGQKGFMKNIRGLFRKRGDR